MSCSLIAFVVGLIGLVDGRVYCTTTNITHFMGPGYSCPLTCANILAAVESLKKSDYNALLARDSLDIRTRRPYQERLMRTRKILLASPINNFTWEERLAQFKDGTRSNIIRRMHKKYELLDNLNFIESADIARMQKELYSLPIFEKKDYCKKLFKVNKTELYRKCMSRRFGKPKGHEAEFIRGMTKVLNRFALPDYPFTTEMTALLLRKIFGSRMDLRQGEQVVSLIVNYFKKALKKSRQMARQRKTVIHLASQHCITTHLTGCFCVKGYVEKDKLCVAPRHCLVPFGVELDEKQSEYLSRIILH